MATETKYTSAGMEQNAKGELHEISKILCTTIRNNRAKKTQFSRQNAKSMRKIKGLSDTPRKRLRCGPVTAEF
jgi:hypothetical protein